VQLLMQQPADWPSAWCCVLQDVKCQGCFNITTVFSHRWGASSNWQLALGMQAARRMTQARVGPHPCI
jgi:hypothetical protein